MGQVPLGLRLDEDLLARIDEARGDVPRARWVARAIEAALVVEKSRRGADAAARAIVAEPHGYSERVVEDARRILSEIGAVEQALSAAPVGGAAIDRKSPVDSAAARSAAPAEQPSAFRVLLQRSEESADLRSAASAARPFVVENVRSSSQSKRGVRPVPKKDG